MLQTAEILLVEDNRADEVLLKEALNHIGWPHSIQVAQNGVEALIFLRQRVITGAPRPDLIVLDLNLPMLSGREVLADIRPDPDLGQIPVIILTSSRADYDILSVYGLPEDAYIVKPLLFEGYVEVGKRIRGFWQQANSR